MGRTKGSSKGTGISNIIIADFREKEKDLKHSWLKLSFYNFILEPDITDFIWNVKICHKHIVCLWNFNSTTTKGFCGRNKFQNKNEDYYYASNKQWYKFTGSIFSCICVQLVTLFITNGSSQLLIIRVDWGVADGDELLCRLSRNREGCQCNRCSL